MKSFDQSLPFVNYYPLRLNFHFTKILSIIPNHYLHQSSLLLLDLIGERKPQKEGISFLGIPFETPFSRFN